MSPLFEGSALGGRLCVASRRAREGLPHVFATALTNTDTTRALFGWLSALCVSVLVTCITETYKYIYIRSHSCYRQAAALGPLPGVRPVQRGGIREIGVYVGPEDRGGFFPREEGP